MEPTWALRNEDLDAIRVRDLNNYIANYMPRFKLIDMHPINLNGGRTEFFEDFADKFGYNKSEVSSLVGVDDSSSKSGLTYDKRIEIFNSLVINQLNGSGDGFIRQLRSHAYHGYVSELDLSGQFNLLFHFDSKKRKDFLNHFSERSFNGKHHTVNDLIAVADMVDNRFETIKEKNSAFATYIRRPEMECEKYFFEKTLERV